MKNISSALYNIEMKKFWENLCMAHKSWTLRNFPQSEPHQAILGIAEELEEFLQATSYNDPEKIEDAIGDMGLFLIDYCNKTQMDGADIGTTCSITSDLTKNDYPEDSILLILSMNRGLGMLSKAQLKWEQGIRFNYMQISTLREEGVRILFSTLQAMSRLFLDKRLEDVLYVTAGRVHLRDWIKNPMNGLH